MCVPIILYFMASKTSAKETKAKVKSVKTVKSTKVEKKDTVAKKTETKPVKSPKTETKVKSKKQEVPLEAPVQLSPAKQEIIGKFQIKSNDTGSPEVQIALLSNRIDKLVTHLKSNPQDNHSRRGLLGIVSKRRRLLHYLETRDMKRYKDIAKKVGLAK
jgi:small subunit ribosomal protein S15